MTKQVNNVLNQFLYLQTIPQYVNEIMSDFEVFAAWVSSIDIKIEMLKNEFSSDISIQLDYSENSLIIIENYILNNYSSATLQDKNKFDQLDRVISYIGESIRQIFHDSEWKIYLDDRSNLYYGLPCVLTKYSGAICIHFLLREILTTKSGDELNERVKATFNYQKLIEAALKNKE